MVHTFPPGSRPGLDSDAPYGAKPLNAYTPVVALDDEAKRLRGKQKSNVGSADPTYQNPIVGTQYPLLDALGSGDHGAFCCCMNAGVVGVVWVESPEVFQVFGFAD